MSDDDQDGEPDSQIVPTGAAPQALNQIAMVKRMC